MYPTYSYQTYFTKKLSKLFKWLLMKMFVNKNMWNWKDVLAKTRDIGKVCYLKGNVV